MRCAPCYKELPGGRDISSVPGKAIDGGRFTLEHFCGEQNSAITHCKRRGEWVAWGEGSLPAFRCCFA
jgi:hypothetical protein